MIAWKEHDWDAHLQSVTEQIHNAEGNGTPTSIILVMAAYRQLLDAIIAAEKAGLDTAPLHQVAATFCFKIANALTKWRESS